MRIFLLLILSSSFLFSQTNITASEKNTLLNLYQQTDGENWSIQWDLNKEPRSWYGVKIKNGSVIELRLNANLLKGSLPSLSGLPNLKKLDIASNRITGSISSINNLIYLEKLDISDNLFSGDISNEFSALSNLTELHIGENQFTLSQPNTFLQNFRKLTHLDISNTQLSTVPNSILSLQNLSFLNLNNNHLENNIAGLSSIKTLEILYLSNNKINQIPTSFTQLNQLKELNLGHNLFTNATVSNLKHLEHVEWLSLENNQLTTIPTEITNLKKLVHLNLGRNQIINGFSTVATLENLQQLWLNNNKLEGNFPNRLLQAPKLLMVSLANNNLSGNLPSQLPFVTDIRNNRFTLIDIKNYTDNTHKEIEFLFSPQRYDDAKTIGASLGGAATLTQSLTSNEGYQFSWFKNLENNTNIKTESLRLNPIKAEDFTSYTSEAYFLQIQDNKAFEMSFFREPISLENELGIEELKKDIAIYPNPTSDFINILSKNIKVSEAHIYDLTGKHILSTEQSRINVQSFPSGAYVITLKTEKGIISFKWIKN